MSPEAIQQATLILFIVDLHCCPKALVLRHATIVPRNSCSGCLVEGSRHQTHFLMFKRTSSGRRNPRRGERCRKRPSALARRRGPSRRRDSLPGGQDPQEPFLHHPHTRLAQGWGRPPNGEGNSCRRERRGNIRLLHMRKTRSWHPDLRGKRRRSKPTPGLIRAPAPPRSRRRGMAWPRSLPLQDQPGTGGESSSVPQVEGESGQAAPGLD